jgi:hypothetical protein
MDEIIPFLIFVAFTIFEAIRGRKKKKSRLKKAESNQKEDSVTTENVKPAKTSDFLEGFLSSFPFSEEISDTKMDDFIEEEIQEEPIVSQLEEVVENSYETKAPTNNLDLIVEHREDISSSFKAVPLKLLSLKNLQMSYIPIASNAEKKSIDFSLKNKKAVKQAIIANLIFNRPRAYDSNFDSSNII